MKIQTFSIIAGSEACNARCPFCVSKMTPPEGIEVKEPDVNWRNFKKACLFAHKSGVTTVMFTGKGEPTLFPGQISQYLQEMEPFNFPFIELQTNGIKLAENPEKYDPFLKHWYLKGMTTIAISICHYNPEFNRLIYLPYKNTYIDLPALIEKLRNIGFSVRLTCVMVNGGIDSIEKVINLAKYAKKQKVEQLSIRPVNKPDQNLSRNQTVWGWINENHIPSERVLEIEAFLQREAHILMTLAHGAQVFDLAGQNICLTDSLTIHPQGEDIRQLIFFPDGHLRYDWQYEGAILL